MNSSQTFKTGELCPAEASYQCLLCRDRDQSTVILLTTGGIFPSCTACETIDATWRRVKG